MLLETTGNPLQESYGVGFTHNDILRQCLINLPHSIDQFHRTLRVASQQYCGQFFDILAAGHINLLETLGERIVDFCLGYVQVQAVHLEIIKLEAHDDCEVGYETHRRR